ncbi:MAG: hypothetical protein ACLUNI_09130, partial [Dialister invisus]|uniref:hypothetical protein n=1 Tax=Dialister invisus TaxID=218538 RepID=UPI003993924E
SDFLNPGHPACKDSTYSQILLEVKRYSLPFSITDGERRRFAVVVIGSRINQNLAGNIKFSFIPRP